MTEIGRDELSFDCMLAAPPEKVWRALTIPAFLERWLPEAVTPAPQREVTEATPPHRLQWRWQEGEGEAPSVVTFTLMPSQDGGTLLRLVHVRQTAPVLPAANSNGRTLAMAA